jgi:SH3-like domain-containing protein
MWGRGQGVTDPNGSEHNEVVKNKRTTKESSPGHDHTLSWMHSRQGNPVDVGRREE